MNLDGQLVALVLTVLALAMKIVVDEIRKRNWDKEKADGDHGGLSTEAVMDLISEYGGLGKEEVLGVVKDAIGNPIWKESLRECEQRHSEGLREVKQRLTSLESSVARHDRDIAVLISKHPPGQGG